MITAGHWLSECGLDRIDALALMRELADIPHARLLAHPEFTLDAVTTARLDAAAARLRTGIPLAYVLGWREFHGLRFAVSPAVLVPRPDTELLVEFARRHLASTHPARVLDLGTGSGAVAVSIADARPRAEVWALDASLDALAQAGDNARTLLDPSRPGGVLKLRHGDWFAALGADAPRFDLIVGNPPYIGAHDPHLDALRYEPALALVGARPCDDGLADLRHIITAAPRHLLPGAWLALEHGYDQATAVRDLLNVAGLDAVHSVRDLAGIERISAGRLSPPTSAAR